MSYRVKPVSIYSLTSKSVVQNLQKRASKRDKTFAIYFLKNRELRWVFRLKIYYFQSKSTKKYEKMLRNDFHLLIASLVIEGLSIVVRFYKLWLIYSHNRILNF